MSIESIEIEELIMSPQEILERLNRAGTSRQLSFYISPGGELITENTSQVVFFKRSRIPEEWQYNYMRDNLNKISDFINLEFIEVSNKFDADLILLIHPSPQEDALSNSTLIISHVSGMEPPFHEETNADLITHTINSKATQQEIFLHELGHFLGLEHPWDKDDGDYAVDSWSDKHEATRMGYNEHLSGESGWYEEKDIAALQSIWGSSIFAENQNAVEGNTPAANDNEETTVEATIIKNIFGDYILVPLAVDFQTATAFSKQLGGNLVEFETIQESRALWRSLIEFEVINNIQEKFNETLATDGGNSAYAWIGGSDDNTESISTSSDWNWNWKWIESNNEISRSFLWGKGHNSSEPDDYENSQHRLAIGLEGWPKNNPGNYGFAGEWNDLREDNNLWFITELPANDQKIKITNNVVGKGAEVKPLSTISVHYQGRLENGLVFDSSYGKAPFTFEIGRGKVIQGWDQGLNGMRVGGELTIEIPASLAYGTQERNKIPANSNLVFDIKLLSIENSTFFGEQKNYKFFNRGNDKYEIETATGFDNLTGLTTITFTGDTDSTNDDITLDLVKDIKGTFDQITGKEDHTGQMFRLYNAAFARFPDAEGLAYWIDVFGSGINTKRQVANSFLGSKEFSERYGANVSDSLYVDTLYTNVLGRLPDAEGKTYWLGQLSSGRETRAEALLGFAESTENKAIFSEMTGVV